MRFKEFLTLQEFRSNVPQGGSFSQEELAKWVHNSTLFHFTLSIPDKKTITVYEYNEFGVNDKFIILTDRVHKDDIVGYMWLNNTITNSKYWQVRDVTIFDPYKRNGLGFDLYVMLIREGYELINGFSLSTEAEKLWRKLHTKVTVNTYDKDTNEISDFDERPKEDNSYDDTKHKFFWLATSTDKNLRESLSNKDPGTLHWFMMWLEGSTSTPGGFRNSKFGEEGDL